MKVWIDLHHIANSSLRKLCQSRTLIFILGRWIFFNLRANFGNFRQRLHRLRHLEYEVGGKSRLVPVYARALEKRRVGGRCVGGPKGGPIRFTVDQLRKVSIYFTISAQNVRCFQKCITPFLNRGFDQSAVVIGKLSTIPVSN